MVDVSITEQIQATSAEIKRLEAERADLSNKMQIAASDADSASLIALNRRSDELPVEIRSARLRLARLRLAQKEETQPELAQKRDGLIREVDQLRLAASEAQLALDLRRGALTAATEDVRDGNIQIGELKHEIDFLIAEATGRTASTSRPLGDPQRLNRFNLTGRQNGDD